MKSFKDKAYCNLQIKAQYFYFTPFFNRFLFEGFCFCVHSTSVQVVGMRRASVESSGVINIGSCANQRDPTDFSS